MSNTASPNSRNTPPLHFPQFLSLPLEIQHQIWRECIEIPQFVHVHVYSIKKAPSQRPIHPNTPPTSRGWYRIKNELGNVISSFPYRVHIPAQEGWQPTVLVSVSRSARNVYDQVYRVRMPVRTADGSRILRLSPDFNIVWIIGDRAWIQDIQLTSFLHDVMAYDPQGIGIKHLALGGGHHSGLSVLASMLPPTRPKPLVESMAKILSSSIETYYAVLMPGINTKCPYQPPFYDWSQPRMPHSLIYQRVPCEPLPIYDESKYTGRYGFFPSNLAQWIKVKENYGAKRHIPMRYLVSVSGLVLDGYVMDDAFMQRLKDSSCPWNPPILEGNRVQDVPLLPAVGFWSFPADIFEAALNIRRHDAATATESLSQDNTEFWILD
ncbi:hypothetical protein VHEMI04385 [[Torrubiella] hemipterigena]|uniref:2EXR domain-containing protein n=1 Tax=[Torrubiella] hemipterigena TaxID=1531966 RepID=A0A0A1TDN1_9HYPO|nr:hypothetical protein VHEMI04385 [[Torrubiella] hemipterigena]